MRRCTGLSSSSLCRWYWPSFHKRCCEKLTSLRGLHPEEIGIHRARCRDKDRMPFLWPSKRRLGLWGQSLRLGLSVKSIRCSPLSPGCCPPEALWKTFERGWFVLHAGMEPEDVLARNIKISDQVEVKSIQPVTSFLMFTSLKMSDLLAEQIRLLYFWEPSTINLTLGTVLSS